MTRRLCASNLMRHGKVPRRPRWRIWFSANLPVGRRRVGARELELWQRLAGPEDREAAFEFGESSGAGIFWAGGECRAMGLTFRKARRRLKAAAGPKKKGWRFRQPLLTFVFGLDL